MIRPAAIEDLDRVVPLCRHFEQLSPRLRFEPRVFLAIWSAFLGSGQGAIFLLEDAGQVVGAIAGVAYPEPYAGERVCQEFFWWTEPSHRGRGLALYKALQAWAREQQCVELRMGQLTDVLAGKLSRFFQREGFTAIEVLYSKRMV